MEEVELRLVNSTPFCQLSAEFPDITMFRWCSSVVDYVEVYGDGESVKMAMERLKEITENIDSKIVTLDRMEDHVSAGISCRCNTVNSSIRLAESMNLLWEAPAVYANGEEKLRLVSFSGEDLDAFYLEASRGGKAVIERKKRIEPDSLKDVYSISLKGLFGELSGKQALYLREAVSMGMFSSPRRSRVEELARIHGLSKSTMQEHINKARNKLIQAVEPYLTLYIHSKQ